MTVIPVNELINHAKSGDWSLFQQQTTTDTDPNVTILCARLDTTNNAGTRIVEADIIAATPGHPYVPRFTFTKDQFDQGAITAACVVYAESGGDPDAKNVNGPNSSAPGSIDRGLFQFNNEAWPKITDAMAYNPRIAFLLAWRITNGWQDFGPWHGSAGLDRTSPKSAVVLKEYESMTGKAVPEPLFGLSLGGVLDWAKALGRLLSKLIDPAFWKRIGVGAIGLLLIVGALVLIAATMKG